MTYASAAVSVWYWIMLCMLDCLVREHVIKSSLVWNDCGSSILITFHLWNAYIDCSKCEHRLLKIWTFLALKHYQALIFFMKMKKKIKDAFCFALRLKKITGHHNNWSPQNNFGNFLLLHRLMCWGEGFMNLCVSFWRLYLWEWRLMRFMKVLWQPKRGFKWSPRRRPSLSLTPPPSSFFRIKNTETSASVVDERIKCVKSLH